MAGKASFVRMIVDAGKASPSPPVGPALGSKGVKAMDFCKLFNAQTAHIELGTPMRVNMTVKPDRTFTFQILSPPTSSLILKALGIDKGSPTPSQIVGQLSVKHVYEIAKLKQVDSGMELRGIARAVASQARNMGVTIVA